NDSAAAGVVGEYVSSAPGSSSFPTSSQWGDYTSISLTAGDWDVTMQVQMTIRGTTTDLEIGLGTVAGNNPINLPSTGYGSARQLFEGSLLATNNLFGAHHEARVSVSAATT